MTQHEDDGNSVSVCLQLFQRRLNLMINSFSVPKTLILAAMLAFTAQLRAEEVLVIQEDFEGGVVEELNFVNNNNAVMDIADDPAGGDRGKVGVIDLTGGGEWGGLWSTPDLRLPLAPLGISPGVDTFELKADFFLPEDTSMVDPDTVGVIVRWVDETESGKNEAGNHQLVSSQPSGEWFTLDLSGTIPDTFPGGTVTHVRPIMSFRDRDDDAEAAAVYIDNIALTVTTSGEDPNLNISKTSPFSTYTDFSSRAGTLSISNSGINETLTISEAKLEGADAEHYKVETDIPLELPPGELGEISIRFTPGKGAGAYMASLVLVSNDSSDPEITVPLSALIIGNTGSELIVNGDFEAGSTSGFTSNSPFKVITEPVHSGEFAAVYEFAGGLQWGSVNLDQPPPLSPEEGPTRHIRITEDMWEKEWFFSSFYSKPEENAITDEDSAQFIIRWNGVQPDAGPFSSVKGADLVPGEWFEYTETGIVPTEWPPESGNPVTEAFLIFSFRDLNSDAVGGEQIYVDDWSFNIDGIALEPLPGPLSIVDVGLNEAERSITTTWTSQSGEWFAVSTSTDLENWTDLGDAVPASDEGDTTSFTDDDLGDDTVRYYRIARVDAPPFIDTGFEDGMGDWTVALWPNGSETGTTWEFGPPTQGPGAARSGDNAAGTDLDADYEAGTTIVLRSPIIDTKGATRVGLSFWYYLDALEGEGGQVKMLETDGSDIATLLDPFIGGEDGNTSEWTQASTRLPDMDRPFILEFQFLSAGEGGETGAGWFIDDIRVGK